MEMDGRPVVCPHCGELTRFVSSAVIYGGRDFGMIYLCKPCDAYVGVHKGTDKPKGTPANKELREWRKKAHAAFDPLWEAKLRKRRRERGEDYKKYWARGSGYKWLAQQLGLTTKTCHIGEMNIEQCMKVVEVCGQVKRKKGEQNDINRTSTASDI